MEKNADHTTWIIVADGTTAKIFSACKTRLFNNEANAKDLKLISEHQHPESRKKDIDLVSDKQGYFGSGNFQESTDPRRHQEELFAHEIAKVLEHARNTNSYHDLILIAPPAFMGLLNKSLSNQARKIVSLTIEKDYTRVKENEWLDKLREHL